MKYSAVVTVTSLSLFVGNAFANEQSSSTSLGCDNPTNAQHVLDCAIARHPEVRKAELSALQIAEEKSLAEQRVNPELEGSSSVGDSLGDQMISSELRLMHTFEIGSKREARVDKAKARLDVARAYVQKSKEEIAIQTVQSLYRLKQIGTEIDILDRSRKNWKSIRSVLKGRPVRSPEQEVLMNVFEMASIDADVQISRLKAEEIDHRQFLEVAIGHSLQLSPTLYPKDRADWPEISDQSGPLVSADVILAQSRLNDAKSDLFVERSLSWPNLKVGPVVQVERAGPIGYPMYGVAFSLPLPLFHQNQGGRASARKGLEGATEVLALTEHRTEMKRKREVAQYRRAVEVLKNIGRYEEVEKAYRKTENLFRRGVLESALVIEAHRQMLDSTRSLNEQELRAVETLWAIYAIDGTIFKEKI